MNEQPQLEAQDTDQLREITQDTPPNAEPWHLDVTGKVVEVMPSAVKLSSDAHPEGIVMATSSNVKVFKDGDPIPLSTLQPGDQITVLTERRGNRADGLQSLVVQINVATELQTDEGDIGGTQVGDNDTLIEEPGYEVDLQGQFVKADSTTVTIRNSADASLTTLPMDPAAVVYKGAKSGGVSLLKAGDRIQLTTEQRGNRQDGWIHVVSKITAQVDAD